MPRQRPARMRGLQPSPRPGPVQGLRFRLPVGYMGQRPWERPHPAWRQLGTPGDEREWWYLPLPCGREREAPHHVQASSWGRWATPEGWAACFIPQVTRRARWGSSIRWGSWELWIGVQSPGSSGLGCSMLGA